MREASLVAVYVVLIVGILIHLKFFSESVVSDVVVIKISVNEKKIKKKIKSWILTLWHENTETFKDVSLDNRAWKSSLKCALKKTRTIEER